MNKKILFIALLGMFLFMIIPNISAVCTVTLDSTEYVEGEIVEVDMTCSTGGERSQSYTLNWTNATGSQLEVDTGTTPSTINTLFSETFTIPSGYETTYGDTLNVTLTLTVLEGTDSATVSTAGVTNLIITDIVISPSFLVGRFGALDFKVTDSSGNAVSNAQCIIDIVDENDLPIAPAGGKIPVPSQGDGKVLYSLFFDENFVEEGKAYKWDMACTCLNTINSTSNEIGVCTDGSNGNKITSFKHGETQFPFTMDYWLTVNTVVDRSTYIPRQTIFICSNVTNAKTTRTPLHIFHQVRCSSEMDDNNDLDRSLIITDGLDYDERGINANTTQMQCKEFIIPEIRHLEGKSSQCVASTNTWVVNEDNEKIKGYSTTSTVFNITSDTINLPVDWAEIGNNKFLAIINLSSQEYSDWSGVGIGNIDIFLNSLKGESFDPKTTRSLPQIDFSSLLITRQIKEIIVWNATEQVGSHLEFLEDGHLEIEIRDQDISQSGWYNVTIEFEDFEKRQTDALEGINTKTGTFHLDVNCPSTTKLDQSMDCDIVAKIEDSQIVQKEVDFTCYISDGVSTYSSVNFNQMVTRNPVTITREFHVPSSLGSGSFVLQCHADYYNLGKRRDSFYDTFLIYTSGGSSITGGVISEGEPVDEDEKEDGEGKGIFGEIISKIGKIFKIPEITESKPLNLIIVGSILALLIGGIAGGIIFFMKRKKKHEHHYNPHNKFILNETLKRIFIIIISLTSIIALILAIYYGAILLVESLSNINLQGTQMILKNSFSKLILLIGFLTLIIIILFKSLNIQGEIRFGDKYSTRRFHEDRKASKMQKKLNRIVLKNEIKNIKKNKK